MGAVIDFSSSKLKQGFWEHAIFAVDRLADETLKAIGIKWNPPIYPSNHDMYDEDIEDDGEINLEKDIDKLNSNLNSNINLILSWV